jgi:hypothetical protein
VAVFGFVALAGDDDDEDDGDAAAWDPSKL